MNGIPMYARDLGLLIVNKTTHKYMPHGMLLRAVYASHIVIIPDGQGYVVALDEDFSRMYEVVNLGDTNLPIP